MKNIVLALLLSSAAILPSLPSVALAQSGIPKGVSETAGERCSTPPRGSGVIVGVFSGVKESPFLTDDDARVPVDRYRCFTSMPECKGWLYTMQSNYSDAGAPRAAFCERR
jgi:hypothetical protein